MKICLVSNREAMGRFVASEAAQTLREALHQNGSARLIVATGASQFEVLDQLTHQPDIDWSRVTAFHLDEYVGLSADHPASFCGYLKKRFVDRVNLGAFHYLPGDEDVTATIQKVGDLLVEHPVDLALVGIGENAHLAFNDPPADFEIEHPYLVVELDEACRQQQVGEGWFASMEEVPRQAMSMSIRQILRTRRILCSVPDQQKADAVRRTLLGSISVDVPASILREHGNTLLIIDEASASGVEPSDRKNWEIIP